MEFFNTPLINSSDLLSYYQLEGNLNDYKEVANCTGTNTTFGSQYGKFNQGVHFSGNGGAISPNDPYTNAQLASGGISLWTRINGNPSGEAAIYDIEGWVVIKINTSGNVLFWSGSPFSSAHGSGVITNNTWHNIVLNWNGANAKLYIDTVLDKTNASASPNVDSTPGRNSHFGYDPTRYLTGDLDDIAIMAREFTIEEINRLYVDTSPLPFHLRMT